MSKEADDKAFDEWCPWGKLTQVRKGARAAWKQLAPEISVRDTIINSMHVELLRTHEALEMEKHLRKMATVELTELRPLKADLQHMREQIKSMQENTRDIISSRHEIATGKLHNIQKMKDQIERLLKLLRESNATAADIELIEHVLVQRDE